MLLPLMLLLLTLLLLMLQCFETQAEDGRASFAGKEVCNDTTHCALAIEQLRHHSPACASFAP
jgi:hypothetical protein